MNILCCIYVPTLNQFALIVCSFFTIFSPITRIFAFKTGGCMVLFGIAFRLFVFCFVFCVVEMLTSLRGLYCPVGGGVGLGLWGWFVIFVFAAFALAFALRLRVRAWLGGGGWSPEKNCAVFRLQLILNV